MVRLGGVTKFGMVIQPTIQYRESSDPGGGSIPFSIQHFGQSSDKGGDVRIIQSAGGSELVGLGSERKQHFVLRRLWLHRGLKPHLSSKDTDGTCMHV